MWKNPMREFYNPFNNGIINNWKELFQPFSCSSQGPDEYK